MGALAVERVEVHRQRGGERFAFAGLHLGDRAVMDRGAAEQLHVEVPHAERAAAGLAHQGEGLDEQLVERLAAAGAVAEAEAFFAELVVGEFFEAGFELGDLRETGGPLGESIARDGADRTGPAARDSRDVHPAFGVHARCDFNAESIGLLTGSQDGVD